MRPCGPFADHLIEIPVAPSLLQPLLSTVPLQVFAAEVAQTRRLRRRQAAQPCEVGDSRIVAGTARRGAG